MAVTFKGKSNYNALTTFRNQVQSGTSYATAVSIATANTKFLNFYSKCSATSGESIGLYNRLYVTGTGGSGQALRAFCTVYDVVGANAYGAHISLNFNSTGKITGLGTALTATLHIPNQSMSGPGGTYAAVNAEINSDGDNSDPAGMTSLAFFRASNQGNANGVADVDDDAVLFDLSGFTSGSAKMWYDHQGTAPANVEEWIKIKTPAGVRWLPAYDAVV